LWYNPDDVILAWDGFYQASLLPQLQTVGTFRHDLIDVSRQSLQEIFNMFYTLLVTAYDEKNTTTFA
jgi:Alpha-N-acetylglucosaminidase (NAGLU) C-terminal domain